MKTGIKFKTMKHVKFLMLLMNLALIIGLVVFSGCGDDDEDPGTPGVTVNAGTDQTVTLGEIVALEGSGTDEAGGAVVFYGK